MFSVNELVVYGNSGLCTVDAVGELNIPSAKSDKTYYTLSPLNQKNSQIYAPVDSEKTVIRKVLSERVCKDLVTDIPFIIPFHIETEKDREKEYRQVLKSCDLRDIVSLIKYLYIKKLDLEEHGKKLNLLDKSSLQKAEKIVYSELQTVLGVEDDLVRNLILSNLKVKSE